MKGNYEFYGCHYCGRVTKVNRYDACFPNLDCNCLGWPGSTMERLFSLSELEQENIEALERTEALGDRP